MIGKGEHISYNGYFLLCFLFLFLSVCFICDYELCTLISSVIKPETPPNLSSFSSAYINLMSPVEYG